uniref:TcfC E-set like domain-containing protein n=1 Tax=Vibrio jasicida TaxID=766224 RepID=UPI0015E36F58
MKKISMIICGLLIYILPLLPEKSFAEQVPEGFEELLETEVKMVKLIVNDDRYINVKGEISNDFFRVTDDEERIYDFLNSQYVENESNRKIVARLISGINSSIHCHGRRSSCQIGIEGINDVQYIVINDELKIRVIVPIKFLSKKVSKNRYVKTNLEQNNALIMHHQLDFSGSEQTLDATYQNEFSTGFLGGYFSGDFIIKPNSDENFDSDKLTFDYLNDDLRFRIGYHNSYSENSWNSTKFLDTSENNNVVSLDFGNTKELEYESSNYSERIYFSIPTSGRLEVSRNDGRVLIRRNVSAGQNYISYSELPHGIYDIEIVVNQG